MLTKFVCQLIATSVRFAWLMIVAFVVLVVLSALYVSRHFAISTDVSHLINPGTAWAQRSAAIDTAFPQRGDTTLVVVRAPIPEFANQAASELAAALAAQPAMFHSVNAGANSEFFKRNGLLFLPSEQLTTLARQLSDGRPLLNALAHDPSLRGLSNLLSVTLLTPLQTGQVTLAGMAPLLARSADTVEAALAGRKGGLSWQALADTGSPAGPANALVVVTPVMHYNELQPGAASSQAIRDTAARLQLASRYGATIGLTGSVPLSDDEFASVQEGAALGGAVTVVFVLLILWFALRTAKMVLAVFLTIMGGLLVTAALGLLMVGALNIISVAFAILFIGLGVDFGIQFGMRFRARRLAECDTYCALMAVSRSVALPLTLAAVATSIGFFAFLPTDYRGVAELGLIAGVGILVVAFPSCLTVLPALICALNPPGAASMPGYHWLAPVDRTFQKHRKVLLFGTIALVLAGIPLLWHLRFDFNPLHLKDPNSESMQTLSALAGSDEVGIDNVQVLSPNLTQAKALGERLEDLPEVAKVMSATSFVPDHQPEKMNTIASLADRLLPVLRQTPAPPASDAQRVAALRAAAQALRNAALDHPGAGEAEARRLATSLVNLSHAAPSVRDRAEVALAAPLKLALASLRESLHPGFITLDNLPIALRRDWIAADGRALLDITPRKEPGVASDSDAQLRNFSRAVLRVAPNATGGPIAVQGTAIVVIRAFVEAAVLAIVSITVLLWLTFRRFEDVLLTMVPLLVSGLVTLELAVLFHISLNFANIIALPLLLGVGVAFKIYYVIAWRGGQTELLQHGLTQAIILSAATTGTAFGSLWLSDHPGTASMGKLLVLSLLCTLIGAVFFQPILLGQPRRPSKPT